MTGWTHHLIVAPILVPLATAALLLLLDERQRVAKALISVGACIVLAAVVTTLFRAASTAAVPDVYLLGNWPAPFGIVLVLDRLSALMLALTALLAIPSLVFSLARWHAAGSHFHTMFQLLLMGLNGSFLTGDLFNLFVFFEVMLAASYGLLLHGSGQQRVKVGMHYIALNLVAALLFLIGVSLVYGSAGTLNMADLAVRIGEIEGDRRALLEAGAGILGVVFLIKAGMWPLNFWLPNAYSAAAAPVAGILAIASKVGIYVILRLSLLVFGEGPQDGFGLSVLLYGGMATIAFGAIGVLASQALGRLAGFSVLVSSGTLLTVLGTGDGEVAAGALLYLVSSTVTLGAFFMLIELVERGQDAGAAVLAVTMEAYGEGDEGEEVEIGVTMPGTMAVLGLCFAACGILLSGLPPLSGFIAKFAILTGMVGAGAGTIAPSTWFVVALIVLSGLAALISLTRAGIRTFWASMEGTVPRVFVIEIAPVMLLLLVTVFLTAQAGTAMRFMTDTVAGLKAPQQYIEAVRGAHRAGRPVPDGGQVEASD
ncbi:monovalent cation/H+ antiporter subunit D [Rhizobium sp. TRM95111]|uniref:monovalent cation/H+ antiporter subunit D n=1 Tax=Rhizobium alarense TaxID=2846851 RepID=UPI001F3EDE6C|nr:monovalent cation/H+ antiporter subunit D [Rhizobium alarense]MCF3641138.1 monovalent cation/H+ antiporter subunit D [Rhizobium alarense]